MTISADTPLRHNMMSPLTVLLTFAFTSITLSAAESLSAANNTYLVWDEISNSSLSTPNLGRKDDPRFSMRLLYGHTNLPLIPTFMNAVELLAQYAEMDNQSRVRQRHGEVLPNFPQVEIAVVPAAPATTVDVRLVIWAIYGSMIDMTFRKLFKETEVEILWSEETVAHIYFTIPLDEGSGIQNQTRGFALPAFEGPIDASETSNITTGLNSGNTGTFSWKPILTPDGKKLLPQDVFILCLGTLKVVSPSPITDKVDGPFHIGSEIVDANLQAYLQDRRTPRTRPPYFQIAHIIEAARRIPGWMLERKRFGEFYSNIQVNGRPVGHVLIDKGAFGPSLVGPAGNVSGS